MRERFIAFVALLLLGFALVFLRCWDLQIRSERLFEMKARRNQLRVESVPARRGEIRDRRGRLLAGNRMVFDAQILDPSRGLSDDAVTRLADILGMPEKDLRARLAQARQTAYFLPLTLKRDIGRRTTTVLLENRVDLPEILVTSRPIRHYPNEYYACHVLGHLGRIDPEELRRARGTRDPEVLIGKAGLEKVWEEELCGRPGAKSVLVDVFGWPIEERLKKRPVDGRALELCLDLTVQTILERAIEGRPGAVVAVDPATGDVLGLASYPDYDPNLFTRSLTRRQWAHLADPGRAILLNRACEAAYQPGSTFKIVTAMAALHAGVLAPGDVRTCTGTFQIGKRVAHCWRRWGHGSVDLVRALAKSCNVFFYGLGVDLDEEQLFGMARRLGLGAVSGLGLPGETEGVLPDRAWRVRQAGGGRPRPWTKGDNVNVAIGQGELLVTPLQMAVVAAAVANGGRVMGPRLVRRILDAQGGIVRDMPTRDLGVLPLDPAHLALVRRGLVEVVDGGTARRAALPDVRVWGKTGSAQNPKGRTHAWFVGCMESGHPDVALAVLLENAGSGGGQAVPVARQIMGHVWGYLKSLGVRPRSRDASEAATAVSSGPTAGPTDDLAEIEPDEGDDLPSDEDPALAPLPPPPSFPAELPPPAPRPAASSVAGSGVVTSVVPPSSDVVGLPSVPPRVVSSVPAPPPVVAPPSPPPASPAPEVSPGPPPELVGPSLEDMPEEGDVSDDEMYRY